MPPPATAAAAHPPSPPAAPCSLLAAPPLVSASLRCPSHTLRRRLFFSLPTSLHFFQKEGKKNGETTSETARAGGGKRAMRGRVRPETQPTRAGAAPPSALNTPHSTSVTCFVFHATVISSYMYICSLPSPPRPTRSLYTTVTPLPVPPLTVQLVCYESVDP